jgi:hypothetical protein
MGYCEQNLRPDSSYQNEELNHTSIIAKRSFKNVTKFKYLRRTVRNQNLIHEEIKCRLNLGNTCYHSFQNLLSSHLLSKNIRIKIYKTIILPVVLYGCEIWSLAIREEHRLKVFDNRVLRKNDEVKGMRWAGQVACM